MQAKDTCRMDGLANYIPYAGAAALHWTRDAGQSAHLRCFVVVVVRSFVQPIKCSANAIRSQNTDNGKPRANLDIGSNGRMDSK